MKYFHHSYLKRIASKQNFFFSISALGGSERGVALVDFEVIGSVGGSTELPVVVVTYDILAFVVKVGIAEIFHLSFSLRESVSL